MVWRSVQTGATGPRPPVAGAGFADMVSASAGGAAILDRPDRGVWAIADAVVERPADAIAATVAIEALARLADATAPDPRGIRAVLGRADAAIRAARPQTGRGAGASAIVLHLAAGLATLLWAGDGRAYRRRGATIQRLTRDHALAPDMAGAGARPPFRGVARAIGGPLPVEVESAGILVAPGDRLLLCSHALAAAVPETMIARRLRLDAADAVDALVEAALCAGAPAAATAIAIEIG